MHRDENLDNEKIIDDYWIMNWGCEDNWCGKYINIEKNSEQSEDGCVWTGEGKTNEG